MDYHADYYSSYIGTDGSWDKCFAKRAGFYGAIIRLVRKLHPNATHMIEVGCGLGMFTFATASQMQALHIIAGDISDHAVGTAAEKLEPFANVTVRKLDAENLSFADKSVDIITAFDVLEHLTIPSRLIESAFRILRPGGVFILTTPNPQSLGARLKRTVHPPGSDTGTDIWFAFRDPTHINIQPIAHWRQLCTKAGFACVTDGSDFWWDTPYIRFVPVILQKLLLNGSHRILTRLIGFASWRLGENYIAVWRKPTAMDTNYGAD